MKTRWHAAWAASCLAAVVFGASQATAGDLVYRPINPAFGGNPYNYSWLMDSAKAQNEYKDTDPLEEFDDTLKRRILNTLATRLVDAAFGGYGDDLQSGQYQIGDYSITIATEGSGISVAISDQSTGSSTTVSVPYY
jgi:curli production assembly/transport component CsgF